MNGLAAAFWYACIAAIAVAPLVSVGAPAGGLSGPSAVGGGALSPPLEGELAWPGAAGGGGWRASAGSSCE